MNLIGTSLLLLSLVAADDKPAQPAPKLPIGKDTTYVDGPLDSEGYIDYEAALNDRLSKGITPEKNANVLLWKAIGPTPGGGKVSARYFKRLGIEEPALHGDYFIGLKEFKRDHLKLDEGESDAFDDQRTRAIQRAWSVKDYPQIGAWLKANEKSLAIAVEATKRSDYYSPMICKRNEKDRGPLMDAPRPSLQACRELANALVARAMLRIGEGKFDEAWHDLHACHLLGWHIARGATLLEALVGVSIDRIATNADVTYFERANLTANQIRDRMRDLRGLPPMPSIAEKIELGERFMYLDILRFARRNGFTALGDPTAGAAKNTEAEELKALEKIDWEAALRNSNGWYDRLVAALRVKGRAEREKALAKIEEDLKALKKAVRPVNLAELVQREGQPDKVAGKAVGDNLISLMMPLFRTFQHAYDRTEQIHRNLDVAFALAAFHSDNGRYPAKLDDLAPKYLPTVPDDLYSGKALIYRSSVSVQ
jgi:hypothetical protein